MRNKFIILFGLFFLTIGLFILSKPLYLNYKYSEKVNIVKKDYKPVDMTKQTLTEEETKYLNENNVEGNKAIPTIIDNDTRGLVIGKVAIPSVKMSIPIYKGETSHLGDNMEYGAVTNKIGQEMGLRNYVLSSHIVNNEKQLFGSLYKTKIGDKIYLADTQYIYTYEITDGKVVKPNEIWILDDIDNQATITLYTCIYINEYEEDGVQKTDRTVRFGKYLGKEKITKDKEKEYFGF